MHFIRRAATILSLVCLPACTSYQTLADPVSGLQASPKPVKKARVTVDSGIRFEVRSPRVNGDSLQGTSRDGAPVSVPLAAVQKVEVREPGGATDVLLAVGILLLTAGAVIGVIAIIAGGG